MVKLAVLVAVPPGVVTEIVPLLAPAGTVAVIWVAELTVKLALVPLNATVVAPVRVVPVIVTEVPAEPLVGLNPVTVGAGRVTVKLAVLVAVPPGVVTEIVPLLAPAGTVAVIWVAELTVKLALVPLNATVVAPVRVVPVIVTEVPAEPLVGLNPVTVGAGRVTV